MGERAEIHELQKMELKGQSIYVDSDFHTSSTTLNRSRHAFLTESIATDEEGDEDSKQIAWVKTWWFKRLVQFFAFVSLLSLSMNTPETFKRYPSLKYATLVLDFAVALVFTTEMLGEMRNFGLWKKQKSYLRRPLCIFNASMVLLIWLSIVFHLIEIRGYRPTNYLAFSIPRAPRVFVMLRVFKVFVNFKLPEDVARRCKRQIWSVTIFFMYFMALAAIIGTQMFGQKNQYCFRKGGDVHSASYSDLLISASRCSNTTELGYNCPKGFDCKELDLKPFMTDKHYFDNFFYSLLTVYESSTQEGWVLVMYEMMGFRTHAAVMIYFVLLIFFVAWLVKNVFIAVVSETFADIRSQYSFTKWRIRRRYTGLSSQVIKDEGTGWHLVSVDHEASKGHAPLRVRKFVFSVFFKYAFLVCVVVDALIQATAINNELLTKIAQFAFTILFDVEVLLKIWCVGFRSYLKPRMHVVEFALAVGSTLLALPLLFTSSAFAVFHVMRVVRLVDAVPTLRDFCQKVFGTGKKLGSVVLFTLFFVMVFSALSVQLFLTLEDDGKRPFGTYPEALQAMFQIITQEGWVEILETLMHSAGMYISPLVAIFIVAYHLFSSLIIMSVFVAVIVDNLELDEELKILKQKKLGEESKETQEKLPLRLRIYEKFRENPRLVKMSRLKAVSEFPMPKIRESFLKNFVSNRSVDETLLDSGDESQMRESNRLKERRSALPVRLLNSALAETNKMTKFLRKQSSISALISDSYHRKNAVLSPTELSPRGGLAHKSSMLASSRRFRTRSTQVSRSSGKGHVQGHVSNIPRSSSEANSLQSQLSGGSSQTRDLDIHTVRERREEAQRKRVAQEERLRENHPFFDQPLLTLQRDSWFRHFLQGLVHARYTIPLDHGRGTSRSRPATSWTRFHRVLASQTYLEWIMMVITMASSICMMLETPDKRTFQDPITSAFEYIFIVAMSIELFLRILADGLVFTPHAVIQSFGGVLDVFIYLVSLIFICWQPDKVPAHSGTQALLVLRCLRPLRIITLVPPMRQVILELVSGYKEILKVTALQFLLMFIFASYGVQVFANKLARCNDRNITTQEECVGTFVNSLALPRELRKLAGESPKMLVPRVWKNPRNFNFDNVLNAFLALFETLSLEGWLEMRDVIKSEHVGYSLYVHIYVLLGSMVGLTLFVGVVVTNFNEKKGIALLTVDQRRWQDLKKRLRLAQPLHLPPRPDSGLRALLFDAIQSKIYKRVIIVTILVDCVTIAVAQWKSASDELRDGLIGTAVACSIFFVADAILKIIALTFRGYWHSRRNRFDFFLTCLGILWMILNFSLEGKGSYNASTAFGVIIIVFRFLTLSGKHAILKSLMLTVVMSLFKSFFIIAVLVLLMMCYALVGCILFGTVKFGEAINRNANLCTSLNAMILLFRITTGEDWNKIMHDCMIKPPYCTAAENYWESDCGNETTALVYFISFYVIITFVFLNLFIAVIIENFSLFYSSDEDSLISNTDLRDFQLTWNLVDKYRRGVLTVRQARLVLRMLQGRLEVKSGSLIFKHMCCEIEKLRNGREVSFHDVLSVLAYRSVNISRSLQLEELLEREELEFSIEEEVAIQTIRDWFIRVRQKRAERQHLQLIGRGSPLGSSLESLSNAEEREAHEDEQERRIDSSDEDDSQSALLTAKAVYERPSVQTQPALPRRVAKKDQYFPVQRKRSTSVSFPAEIPGFKGSSPSEPSSCLRVRKSVAEAKQAGVEVRQWWTDQVKKSPL